MTIETAGIKFVAGLACDLMSISPKLSNSAPKEEKAATINGNPRLDTSVLRKLLDNYKCQLKFVVDSNGDLDEIKGTIEMIGDVDPGTVMLMPQAGTRREYLDKSPMVAEMCKRAGFAFSPRLQVMLWDSKRSV